MGDRRLLGARAPRDLADLVWKAAEKDGVSVSTFMTQLLAKEFGYQLREDPDPGQTQLPLGA